MCENLLGRLSCNSADSGKCGPRMALYTMTDQCIYSHTRVQAFMRSISHARTRPSHKRQAQCSAHKITVLPGDGIGPEIAKVAVKVLQAAGNTCGEEFSFDEQLIGGAAM